jgi:hypothetical protein
MAIRKDRYKMSGDILLKGLKPIGGKGLDILPRMTDYTK